MDQKKKKILVIEDERPLLMAIKSKLEIEGYNVVTATDGIEGEKIIQQEKPDLVLLDILLPKKDGFEVLEALKKKKIKVPIIVISNSGQPVEIERALRLGVKDYLIKVDFSPAEVLEKVKGMIGPGLLFSTMATSAPKRNAVQAAKSKISSAAKNANAIVLIVEDDEFLRQLVAQKLTKEGFDVMAAIDSNEAFSALKEKTPQVILLDLLLPGMDGFEILGQLKRDSVTTHIPVIVLSNLGQKEDIDRAMTAGAEDYLIKANFTPSEIVDKIRFVLHQKYV